MDILQGLTQVPMCVTAPPLRLGTAHHPEHFSATGTPWPSTPAQWSVSDLLPSLSSTSTRRAPHPGTSGLLSDRSRRPARWLLAISMLSSGTGGCTRRLVCSPVKGHLRGLQLLVTMSDPAIESQAPGLGRMKKVSPPGLSQRH